MWYVYVLRSEADGNLYIGSTNDLKRRLNEHNSKSVDATKPRTPFRVEAYLAVGTEKKARELEQYCKSGSGHAFLNKRML